MTRKSRSSGSNDFEIGKAKPRRLGNFNLAKAAIRTDGQRGSAAPSKRSSTTSTVRWPSALTAPLER